MRGKGIANLYRKGGPELLASRLTKIFTRIEKDDDESRVLHNDVLAEVMDMINKDYNATDVLKIEEKNFLAHIAGLIMNRGQIKSKPKRFLYRIADYILSRPK